MDINGPLFKGELNVEEAAIGLDLAIQNANRLLADAEILYAAESYASAITLAVLSIEEAGKAGVIRGILRAKDPVQLKKAWREFRSHNSKSILWIVPHMAMTGEPETFGDFAGLSTSNHPQVLDRVKQLATYTECLEGSMWADPKSIGGKDVAEYVLFSARFLAAQPAESQRGLELWLETVKHDAATVEEAEDSMVELYARLQAEGLRPPGPNKVQKYRSTKRPGNEA